MRVVIDIECNGLKNPTQIWCIVCKCIDTGEFYIFRNLTTNEEELKRFKEFCNGVRLWIGHNICSYDLVHLNRLIGYPKPNVSTDVCDTLIVGKLFNYSRVGGHSIESYGEELGYQKGFLTEDKELLPSKFFTQAFFDQWSEDLENYCKRDVEITHRVYNKYADQINNPSYQRAIALENRFQLVCNQLEENGFFFNKEKAEKLLTRVSGQLEDLDKEILDAFQPKEVVVREFTPKLTKHGTINRSSVPRSLHSRIHEYEAGCVYQLTKLEPFNPASHKQIIDVLWEAGWKPEEKTKTHITTEREVNRSRFGNRQLNAVDLTDSRSTIDTLGKYGWKISERNLDSLPASAPAPARTLAKRILLESRRRTLTEWLSLVGADSRIRGRYYGIGAWTHRMSHQSPNMANIPNEFKEDGTRKLLGKEMRSLWCAPRNRLLVGVDAEGIQLRIFAHLIDDKEFTDALVRGRKDDKTDPHSLNQRIIGDVCKTRQAAKRFIFALLLGAGIGKLAEILSTDRNGGQQALDRILSRYTGLAYLKEKVIPADAERGYFIGLDGRPVSIPGDQGKRRHLAMSGYLQNGEVVVVKTATLKTLDKLDDDLSALLINLVHDEDIFEVPNDMRKAEKVLATFCESIEETGVELNLRCPLAGDGKIGFSWYETH